MSDLLHLEVDLWAWIVARHVELPVTLGTNAAALEAYIDARRRDP